MEYGLFYGVWAILWSMGYSMEYGLFYGVWAILWSMGYSMEQIFDLDLTDAATHIVIHTLTNTVTCTMYTVQCTVYSVQCTVSYVFVFYRT